MKRVAVWVVLSAVGCSYDPADRWVEPSGAALASRCTLDSVTCRGEELLRCVVSRDGALDWEVDSDCGETAQVCVAALGRCATCAPSDAMCEEQTPLVCRSDGSGYEPQTECNPEAGTPCRAGRCVNLCREATLRRSNVGCEYWAADLDNAAAEGSPNAADQQFAVVVSNPHEDIPALITVLRDDSKPGEPPDVREVVSDQVPPFGLQVFPLGPREVDGSTPGNPETATHTALTRAAYQIQSSIPVVAYQFNPLDNVDVYSNDASLLKPVEALVDDVAGVNIAYVVLGWPQTIAITDDPLTNFSSSDPSALRAFITLIGTRETTQVEIVPTTRYVGTETIPAVDPGQTLHIELGPFDTLNLETDDFNADFSGTLISSDRPVVVFSGSEASDAPRFEDLSERACCADHLEEQLDHVRTAGRRFVAPVAFNRSLAVDNAGGDIGVVEAKEVFRVIATSETGARVQTTLDGDDGTFELEGIGSMRELLSARDFLLESDAPVMLSNISPSQVAAGVPRQLPGGDPSMLIIPPVEQYRRDYVFLTPESYAFDFLRIIAPRDAEVVLDDRDIERAACSNENFDGLSQALDPEDQTEFTVYRCQLAFPTIDPSVEAEERLLPGVQSDGVHVIRSSVPVGVLVDGFDQHVSYSYAAGTELEQIVGIAR
jgi:hypothetical protein